VSRRLPFPSPTPYWVDERGDGDGANVCSGSRAKRVIVASCSFDLGEDEAIADARLIARACNRAAAEAKKRVIASLRKQRKRAAGR